MKKRLPLMLLGGLAVVLIAVLILRRESTPAAEAVKLQISGMHCAGCVVQVQRSLKEVPGVRSVRVDASRAQARVVLNDSLVGLEDLITAVNRTGFRAEASPSTSDRR